MTLEEAKAEMARAAAARDWKTYRRMWNRIHADRVASAGKRWRRRHPEKYREYQRRLYHSNEAFRLSRLAKSAAYKKAHPWRAKERRLRVKGRVCASCGCSDSEKSFTAEHCDNCRERGRDNGFCGRCGTARFRRLRGCRRGPAYCRVCEESRQEAATILAGLSEEQRRIATKESAARVLLLWEILRGTEGDRFSKDVVPVFAATKQATASRMWLRLKAWVRRSIPRGLVWEHLERGARSQGYLVFRRRQLVEFLEPLATYFALAGLGSRGKTSVPDGEAA